MEKYVNLVFQLNIFYYVKKVLYAPALLGQEWMEDKGSLYGRGQAEKEDSGEGWGGGQGPGRKGEEGKELWGREPVGLKRGETDRGCEQNRGRAK